MGEDRRRGGGRTWRRGEGTGLQEPGKKREMEGGVPRETEAGRAGRRRARPREREREHRKNHTQRTSQARRESREGAGRRDREREKGDGRR